MKNWYCEAVSNREMVVGFTSISVRRGGWKEKSVRDSLTVGTVAGNDSWEGWCHWSFFEGLKIGCCMINGGDLGGFEYAVYGNIEGDCIAKYCADFDHVRLVLRMMFSLSCSLMV